jgi:CBS domain-containing protein
LKTVLIKEVMTDEVVTVRPDDDIKKAAQTMLRKKIGCASRWSMATSLWA